MDGGTREDELRHAEAAVRHLAAIPDRGSASPGELAAASWIHEQLSAAGLESRIEPERAHGTHWWPYGLPSALASLSAFGAIARGSRGSRALAAGLGLSGAAAVIEDVAGTHRVLRRLLPQRDTTNVIAEAGDPTGPTVVIHAHHDAAHGGVMFHPAISRVDGPIPSMATVAAGPGLVGLAALGRRRRPLIFAAAFAAINALLFADSGRRRAVPGANDDASGVAALALLARRFALDPPRGVRVVVLSTGSEESMLEGMTAFARRHFGSLPPATTGFVSIDSVGWDVLALRSGEGALRLRPASARFRELLREAAAERGLELRDGVRFWIPTDGYVALKAGFEEVNVGSEQADGSHPNYHSDTDLPDAVNYATVVDAADIVEALVRRIGTQR